MEIAEYLRSRIAFFCRKEFRDNEEFKNMAVETALLQVNPSTVTTGAQGANGVDMLLAESCANLIEKNFEYTYVASRILQTQIYQTTEPTFSRCVASIATHNPSLLDDSFLTFVSRHAERLDGMVRHRYDKKYTYQATSKMFRQYLLRQTSGDRASVPTVFERPQYMYLRIAAALFFDNNPESPGAEEKMLHTIEKFYRSFAEQNLSAASPMIFHAGTKVGQLSSCFLVGGPTDSLISILETTTQFGLLMKGAGGIGCNVSRIRSAGRPINSSGGTSNGVVPMLKLFDATGRYVDQGGNRRPGVVNVSIEPWHPEFVEVIGLRAPGRQDDKRLFNVHLTVYICDLFMQRAQADYRAMERKEPRIMWSFFSPDVAPALVTTWGPEFERLYLDLEAEQKFSSQEPAANIMQSIVYYQHWTGEPCVVFKDSVNRHSNQLHMGTLTNLNLCVEIALYCDPEYTAVCNISSICLASFIRGHCQADGAVSLFDADSNQCPFDWRGFYRAIRQAVKFLNQVIDRTRYPVPEAQRASEALRPIGIGIQGLADCLIAMELPFGSDLAKRFDTTVYAALYFFAAHKSCSMARRTEPYRFWKESPWCTQNKLHCDGFPGIPGIPVLPGTSSTFIPELRRRVAQYGLRNSQLIAQMPTASTAHLTGNTESFEPLENILYVMREISGNFICINERVAALLSRNNLLTPDNVRIIKESGGSAQGIVGISAHLKQVLRTAYEIPQRELLEHAIARTPYVDQSMSLNVFFNHDASAKLPSYLFHAWRNGLKTATYYVRSKQKGGSIKFTLAPGGTEQPQCESCSA